MYKILFSLLGIVLLVCDVNAQSINGTITNFSGESIADAKLEINGTITKTNADGQYQLVLAAGTYQLTIQAKGYQILSATISVANKTEPQLQNFQLVSAKKEINTITVSGSRFKKRAAEEIVSIEVIKPEFINSAAINRVDDALNKVPGVTVVDNQINIRGGAGWSYGAGSRVMVMVDDMPMLTADAQDAKWDFLPIENCEQIEVLKGAASTLYGSSALNGVVNFRTAYARSKPITKIQLYNGMFGNPNRKEMIWWGKKQPSFMGGYASHSRKIGNTDVVLGSAWFAEDSYLLGDATRRIRGNANIRHKVKSINGLILSLNSNVQLGKSSTFFLHQADTSLTNLLLPYGGTADSTTTLNKNQGTRANVDPIIQYTSSKGWQHNLRNRYLFTQNLIPEKQQTSTGKTFYSEYQAVKKWNDSTGIFKNANFIAGIVGTRTKVTGELYGAHKGYNIAQYIQLEKKLRKIWLVAGARNETNAVDTYKVESRMVYRAGLNYEPTRGTNIRASWGQGYRYPTIAERFVNTDFGAASVFPNTKLQSEFGWSTEIGMKQGFAIGKLVGFADVAVFEMQYKNMMEFNFGANLPDTPVSNIIPFLGFQSRNIGNTKMQGIDVSIYAQLAGKITHNFILGYTYLNPKQINPDSAIMANYSTDRNFLKYRYAHTMKATWDGTYKGFGLASINTINSPMVNIDEVFENTKPSQNPFGTIFDYGTSPNGSFGNGIPTTIKKYRQTYNNWVWLSDIRLSYQLNTQIKVAMVVKNVLNIEYYVRPALIAPMRNFTVQLFAEL
jgi:iron complex outermembrane receptor protein